jgi:hypothetical protein
MPTCNSSSRTATPPIKGHIDPAHVLSRWVLEVARRRRLRLSHNARTLPRGRPQGYCTWGRSLHSRTPFEPRPLPLIGPGLASQAAPKDNIVSARLPSRSPPKKRLVDSEIHFLRRRIARRRADHDVAGSRRTKKRDRRRYLQEREAHQL